MKKLISTSLIAFIFLELSSFISYFIPNSIWTKAWIPLLIGFGLMIISGVFSIIGNTKKIKAFMVLPLISNAIALGMYIEAWYVYRGFDNSLIIMTLVSLAAVLILWLFYLLLLIPIFNNYYGIFITIFIIFVSISYILLIIFTKTTFLSTLGYYLIISTGFLFAISTNESDKFALIKRMANSTYSVVIVGIIILILMCDGDLDFDFSGGDLGLESPKKKRK